MSYNTVIITMMTVMKHYTFVVRSHEEPVVCWRRQEAPHHSVTVHCSHKLPSTRILSRYQNLEDPRHMKYPHRAGVRPNLSETRQSLPLQHIMARSNQDVLVPPALQAGYALAHDGGDHDHAQVVASVDLHQSDHKRLKESVWN